MSRRPDVNGPRAAGPGLIVHGTGLVASGFGAADRWDARGVIFARGVADSTTTDETAYRRELELLSAAVSEANQLETVVVYFSSGQVYGPFGGEPITESAPTRPLTRYGRHKLDCEALVRARAARSLVLRMPNVVGPAGHRRQLVPALVDQVLAGSVTIQTGACRDLVDVADVARTVRVLLDPRHDDPAAHRTIHLASGRCTSVELIVETIAGVLELRPAIRRQPDGEAQRFDITKLRLALGPEAVPSGDAASILRRHVPSIAGIPPR